MGSAPSARGIQLGGQGTAAAVRGDLPPSSDRPLSPRPAPRSRPAPLGGLGRWVGVSGRGRGRNGPGRGVIRGGPLPAAGRPPPGAFPPRRCAATGSGSAWKGRGRRWPGASAPCSTATSSPLTSPLPGAAGCNLFFCRVLSRRGATPSLGSLAPTSSRAVLGPGAGGAGPGAPGGAGDASNQGDGAPPPPARLTTGADCPQCAPDRVASPRAGSGPRHDARGLRRCRCPTRPVLKHGPRSLTRARVRGTDSYFRNPVAQ